MPGDATSRSAETLAAFWPRRRGSCGVAGQRPPGRCVRRLADQPRRASPAWLVGTACIRRGGRARLRAAGDPGRLGARAGRPALSSAVAAGFCSATRSPTGASAAGLDHSEEMVELARERAPGADVVLAEAESLPFPEDAFSAVASMSIVFFFLDDPVAVLRECHRVLQPGGRLAVYTTGPELRGTPAAPEPIAEPRPLLLRRGTR